MLTMKSKKIMSLTLCTLLGTSLLGGAAAEASPYHRLPQIEYRDDAPLPPEVPHRYDNPPHEKHHKKYNPPREEDPSESHSEGEVITAGVVGAVLGAVLAKNT